MRTYLYSALTAATFGLLTLAPANAKGYWRCMGPAVACGGSHSYARSADNYRSQRRVYAPRAERRSAQRPARSRRSEAHAARRRAPTQVASADSRTARASKPGQVAQSGMASYYGTESGSRTASGARMNPSAMTAAHRSLPFGTKVRVTNKRNGRSVVVTINDRGPFVRGRIIDLSTAAAGVIGMRSAGVAPVSLEVLSRG